MGGAIQALCLRSSTDCSLLRLISSSLDPPLPDALQESVLCFRAGGKHCSQNKLGRRAELVTDTAAS